MVESLIAFKRVFAAAAPTYFSTLSLHDALPISTMASHAPTKYGAARLIRHEKCVLRGMPGVVVHQDRKSTRLNSSHANSSYAVFCLKKKTITGDKRTYQMEPQNTEQAWREVELD